MKILKFGLATSVLLASSAYAQTIQIVSSRITNTELKCNSVNVEVQRKGGAKIKSADVRITVPNANGPWVRLYDANGKNAGPFEVCISPGSTTVGVSVRGATPKVLLSAHAKFEGEMTGPLTFVFETDK